MLNIWGSSTPVTVRFPKQNAGAIQRQMDVLTAVLFVMTANSGRRFIMARGKNQHVVKHDDGWAVKGAGNSNSNMH
jgi:hypothetical protein